MKYEIIVIGSGPGGYVAAIRAAQLGKKVAIVEKGALGGVCLNWGCIPTKALLKSAEVYEYINNAEDFGISLNNSKADLGKMIKRSRSVADTMNKGVTFLLKKNKIDVLKGHGTLLRGKKVEVKEGKKSKIYEADNIIIATGARAKELPNLKIDGKNIIGYRDALALEKQPKSMVVVGGGAIGVEFAHFYNAIGTEVTIVEFLEQGLVPNEDKDISKELTKIFKKKGITVMAGTAVQEVKTDSKGCVVTIKENKSGKTSEIKSDVVLSAVGITANLENIGLETLGIKTDKGKIVVDEFYNTNVKGIYAIGDVCHGPALAHVASAEGIICVEKIAGENVQVLDYNNIPACTFCSPEIASVGYTEEAAKKAGYEIKVGKFPFSANGKAQAAGAPEGFIKVIYDKKYGEFLGAHMIGHNVTEMIAEVVAARKLETTAHEIIKTVHPHPTMSEAIMEASAAAYDQVIHL